MEQLFNEHRILINDIDLTFKRYMIDNLPWQERLLGIQGFRGAGKTTIILQYIKETYNFSNKVLYVSLDNIYFAENNLVEFVRDFVANGGEHLFFDEVHKYENWAVEIKNIYDLYKNLKITFTASSLLEIINSKADLSRRAVIYNMEGLSYREFLNFSLGTNFNSYTFQDIINNHEKIASEILKEVKPLRYFKKYLMGGNFPFFKENEKLYHRKIQSIANMVMEVELPLLRKVETSKIIKIKQLLYIISHATPFKPNISKLSQKVGVSRNTLVEYINHLVDARLLNSIYSEVTGISLLQKPEKIYMENSNFSYAFAQNNTEIGNIRETFFLNQLSANNIVTYPKTGDFLIDEKYLFEIGGKNKDYKQIAGIENSFIAADDIEFGFKNKIPLWLFGFMY